MKTLTNAASKSYEELLAKHQADYKNLFNPASLNLTKKESDLPTDRLLSDYKEGKYSGYLEELFFSIWTISAYQHFPKRYFAPTLQGVWNQYELARGTETIHNINIQMNYWPAFNTNLIDLFECYADYHKAYKENGRKKWPTGTYIYGSLHYIRRKVMVGQWERVQLPIPYPCRE